jgi:hypothetical protein
MILASLNIYNLNKENLNSLLDYYCPDDNIGDIDWVLDQNELKLNQIEFALKKSLKHKSFVFSEVGGSGVTISNLLKYACAALYNYRFENGSNNRKRIVSELLIKIQKDN